MTVLNALAAQGLAAPVSPGFAPYAYYTQESLFASPCVQNVSTHLGGKLSARFVASNGATLAEWESYASCFASAARTHASRSTLTAFRAALVAAFNAVPTRFIAINYARTEVGQTGVGHMSPIGAYDATTDRALVLDVARYRYPPVWVKLPVLFAAMATNDTDAGASRGWLEMRLPPPGTRVSPPPTSLPAVNMTASRACMASLARGDNDADGVVACMRSGASAAPLQPAPAPAPARPPAACPAPPAASGGGGIMGALALIFGMSTLFLAITLRKDRQAARTEAAGGMGNANGHAPSAASRAEEGVALLER